MENLVKKRRRWAFVLLGVLSAANALSLIDDRPLLNMALYIYPLDLAGALFFALGLKNILISRRNPNLLEVCLWAIFAYSFLKFGQGAMSFGTPAGVEFRQDFMVLAVMLYLSTVRFRRGPEEIVKLLSIMAAGYVVVAVARKAGLVEQTRAAAAALANDYLNHRLLPADGALIIAIIGMAALVLHFRGDDQSAAHRHRFFWGACAAVALAAATFSFHRSVWVAMAVALTVFLPAGMRWSVFGSGYHRVFILFVILFDLLAAFIFLGEDRIFGSAITEVFDEGSTFRWRVEGWESLIAKMSPIDYVTGMKYGADTSRAVFGQIINNSAHNFYLGVFWISGALGAALYVCLYVLVVCYLYPHLRGRAAADTKITAFILLISILMVQIYFMVYSHWLFASIVVGYSMGFLRDASHASAAQPAPNSDNLNAGTRLRY